MDYQDRAHARVLTVLLDAAVKNETTLALKENGITSLPTLLDYICTPGLIFGLRWKDKNDDNMEKMLHAGQFEELLALFSYFNWLQSACCLIADGVFNIFQTTCQDFRDFIGGSFDFDVRKPIFIMWMEHYWKNMA